MDFYSLVGYPIIEDDQQAAARRLNQPWANLVGRNRSLNRLTYDCADEVDAFLRALFDARSQIGSKVVDLAFAYFLKRSDRSRFIRRDDLCG